MKFKKYLIGILLAASITPAFAQTPVKDAETRVFQVLINKELTQKDKDKEIAKIAKEYKKNPEVLAAIGSQYFYKGNNPEMAQKYAEQALSVSKNKNADALVLQGDIAVGNDDPGLAAGKYQMAMQAEPTKPDAYYRYARLLIKADPASSKDAIEKMNQNVPGGQAYPMAAKMYHEYGDLKLATEYYGKSKLSDLDQENLCNYAIDAYVTGSKEEALKTAEEGLKIFPRTAVLNRIAMMSSADLKDNDKAVYYVNEYFSNSENANYKDVDYAAFNKIMSNLTDNDVIIENYNKFINNTELAETERNNALKKLAAVQKKAEKYDDAIASTKTYLETTNSAKASEWEELGKLYMLKAKTETGLVQQAYLDEADQIMVKTAELDPSYALLSSYQRANIAKIADPNDTNKIAAGHYTDIINSLEGKADISNYEKQFLVLAYDHFMIQAAKVSKNKADAKKYADLILSLDPQNERALAISNAIK